MDIRLFHLPEAESGQLSRRHQQHRQGVGDVLRRAAVGDEQIVDGVEGDGRPQQPAGACDLQPRPLPCVCKSAAPASAVNNIRQKAERLIVSRRCLRRVFSRTRCLTSATRLAVSYISFEPPFRFV